MPGTYQSPGVYVEELPSSVRPVVGVSTSTAAFVDVFARGPANRAVKVSGPGDFERAFGGLCAFSEASYAINQFFVNGGAEAWVVRVLPGDATKARTAIPVEGAGASGSPAGSFAVSAKSEGAWGSDLLVGVQYPDPDDGTSFDVVVGQAGTSAGKPSVVVREVFRSVNSSTASTRYFGTVIGAGSALIDLADPGGGRPALQQSAAGTSGGTSGGSGTTTVRPRDLASSKDPQWFYPLADEGDDGTLHGDAGFSGDAFAQALAGSPAAESGMWALDTIAPDIFNILCIPAMALIGDTGRATLLPEAEDFCSDRRAMLLVDPPDDQDDQTSTSGLSDAMWACKDTIDPHPNAAAYFPRLTVPDPVVGGTRTVGPSGTVAGIWARTDASRGVWKAPAGTDATLFGATPVLTMTEAVSDRFNPVGINVLRTFPVFNSVVWGARTRAGADLAASQWKYVPVRRTALYIEESLREGLQWVVFEPNDEPLWSQIRLNVGSFMQRLFRQGAFAGTTPAQAYLVKCDSDTTTADDVSVGVVNVLVGFQPLLPCEFVVIKIQQLTRPPEA